MRILRKLRCLIRDHQWERVGPSVRKGYTEMLEHFEADGHDYECRCGASRWVHDGPGVRLVARPTDTEEQER